MKNTNVIELYHLLDKENQITFYNSGIGTYATPSWKSWSYRKQQLDNTLDLAIAWFVFIISERGTLDLMTRMLGTSRELCRLRISGSLSNITMAIKFIYLVCRTRLTSLGLILR